MILKGIKQNQGLISKATIWPLILCLGLLLFSLIWGPAAALAQSCTLSGDCNCDDTVDIFDLVIVGNSFGQAPGDSGYDPRADTNQSGGAIDILDLIIVGANFGATAQSDLTISNITDNRSSYPNNEIPKYEKFEISFSISILFEVELEPTIKSLTTPSLLLLPGSCG